MSSARVNRPTSCSSWVIRSAEASDCLSAGSKRVAAFSRSCRFHFESCSSLRLWGFRHTSAWELSLLRVSRTTSDLKLGSEVSSFSFRHRILLSSRWILYHNLVLESGPNFRWQYITPITKLTQLEVLSLHWNQINNITPLTNMTKLIELYISESPPIQESEELQTLLERLYNVKLNPEYPEYHR